jgi:carnitine O-acetyltransferase
MLRSMAKKQLSTQSTYAHQKTLPRLPVPALEATCKLYLETVLPLASPTEFATTQRAVDSFLKNEGPKLQVKLLDRVVEKSETSWLHSWWTDHAYMSFRDPIVVWVSFFFCIILLFTLVSLQR